MPRSRLTVVCRRLRSHARKRRACGLVRGMSEPPQHCEDNRDHEHNDDEPNQKMHGSS